MEREFIDKHLQADFFVETMLNETFDELLPELSDDINIASLQSTVAQYCKKSKAAIIAHKIQDSDFTSKMSKFLSKIVDNFLKTDYENIPCIKGLLLSDKNLVIKQIETLSFASMINKLKDIKNNNEVFAAALNIEGLSISVGYYCYLTLIINSNITTSYNELFIKAWFNYLTNIQSTIMMFQIVGDEWKSQFIGAPFSID